MILISNKNKLNKKFLPLISIIKDEKELKKQAKKQLMQEIINDPMSIKAYNEIETYKIAEIDEEMNIKPTKKELLFTYEQLIHEIIDTLIDEMHKISVEELEQKVKKIKEQQKNATK